MNRTAALMCVACLVIALAGLLPVPGAWPVALHPTPVLAADRGVGRPAVGETDAPWRSPIPAQWQNPAGALGNPGGAGSLRTPRAAADETGRYIVRFRQRPGSAARILVQARGGQIRHAYRIIPAMAVRLPARAVDALATHPSVAYVEPDGRVQTCAQDVPWGITRVGAPTVHAAGNKGTGIKVAIIDTGIDYNHPDLAANYKGGWDFVNSDNDPMDDHGHGTHCAGTVAALDNDIGVIGVAPEAWLYGVKVLDASGNGWTSDIIAGIEWCLDNGIKVASMSLGGGTYSQSFEEACRNVYRAGVLVVAAAGNEGPGADTVQYPARYPSVIAVSAIDSGNNLASFSSRGPAVELTAPGVGVLSTKRGGGYEQRNGTSMACPHVAGVAALVMAHGITGASAVRGQLQCTAEDLGVAGRDNLFGFGVVRADLAVGSSPQHAYPVVWAVVPPYGVTGTNTAVTVIGTDFRSGATVKLTRSGATDIPGTEVVVVAGDEITCSFNLNGAAPGMWNVVVTNDDSKSGCLDDGFTVASPGDMYVGTGTETIWFPMGTFYHDQRTQVIYLSDEIGAARTIKSLGLYVKTVPGETLNNWTIRMKHTTMSQYGTSPAWESTGWTTVHQSKQTVTGTGWVVFGFNLTNFDYDGHSNLLVDFSFNNNAYSSDGVCRFFSPGGPRTIQFRTDSAYGDPLGWSGTTNPTPSVSYLVPHVLLSTNPRISVNAIVPNSGPNSGPVDVTITGMNFPAGATTKLTRAGQADIPGTDVVVSSETQITCSFDLDGAEAGAWNVVVTKDDESAQLDDGFAVLPSGEMIIIGSGTDATWFPMGTYYEDQRTQVIYLADEIGMAGTVDALGLYVTTVPGQTLTNWTIRIKHTAMSQYGSTPAWESTGWTVVHQSNQTVSSTGWVVFEFNVADFDYDGESNMLVDFSFNNSSYSVDGQCRFFLPGGNRTIQYRTDSLFGDPLNWSGSSDPTPSVSNRVPQLLLNMTSAPAPPTVTAIEPDSGANDAPVDVTITGTGFRAGAAAKLTKAGQGDINATGVDVVGDTQIACTFDITGAEIGAWNVVVINDDDQSGQLDNGFEVLQADISPPHITGWDIRVTHGSGVGEIIMPIAGGYIEPRNCGIGGNGYGGAPTVLHVHFSEPLDPATVDTGSISITGVRNGACSDRVGSLTLQGDGSVIRITFSAALPDRDTYTLTLSADICDPAGNPLAAPRSIQISALKGDANSSKTVTSGDMLAIRPHVGGAVNASTARHDINLSGTISSGDMLAVQPHIGGNAP